MTRWEAAGKEIKYSERSSTKTVMVRCWAETAAACCCHDGEGASPTNGQTSNDEEKRPGAKTLATLGRVRMRSSMCTFNLLILN